MVLCKDRDRGSVDMIKANVDTPWESYIEDGEEVYGPKLARDPAFADLIKPWTDQTGKEWHEWGGQQVKGGNYAKDSPGGIKTGKHGDPDYLTIQIKVEHENTLVAIDDAGSDYWVYWSEVIEEGEGPVVVLAAGDSFSGDWMYRAGTIPATPPSGEMYFRVPAEILRINKTSQSTDMTANLEALKRGDLIQVGVEEYWEVRNISVFGAYVELEVSDLQKGPNASTLPEAVHTFDFDTSGAYHKPGNNTNAVEWDALVAKLQSRGVSPAWINANLGTQRERMRSEHDSNMRHGYAVNQLHPVNIVALAAYLESEGWTVTPTDVDLHLERSTDAGPEHWAISRRRIVRREFDGLPGPLKHDILQWLVG